MGFRFRGYIRVRPWLRVNLSKTGASLSVGKPGATLNFKRGRAARATVGLPGTGLSWSQKLSTSAPPASQGSSPEQVSDPVRLEWWILGAAFLVLYGLSQLGGLA